MTTGHGLGGAGGQHHTMYAGCPLSFGHSKTLSQLFSTNLGQTTKDLEICRIFFPGTLRLRLGRVDCSVFVCACVLVSAMPVNQCQLLKYFGSTLEAPHKSNVATSTARTSMRDLRRLPGAS